MKYMPVCFGLLNQILEFFDGGLSGNQFIKEITATFYPKVPIPIRGCLWFMFLYSC